MRIATSIYTKNVGKFTVGKDRIIGRVYLPEEWIGRKVKIILIDEQPEEKTITA